MEDEGIFDNDLDAVINQNDVDEIIIEENKVAGIVENDENDAEYRIRR